MLSSATDEWWMDSLNLYNCPKCKAVLKVDAKGTNCLCPQCGLELRIPGPARATALGRTCKTNLAEPPHVVPLDPTRLLRLRAWATAVRDRSGTHSGEPEEVSKLGKTLCKLLDTHSGLQSDNVRNAVDGNVALLVGLLLLAGARWPE